MRFLILLGAICLSGPFFPTVGSSQQNSNPFGFAPSAPTMAVPFFGNPAKSDDVEAKSMSPPQWGDEFAPLPTDKRQPAPKNQFNGQRPNQLSSPVADPARQKKENGSFVQASSPTKPAPTNSLVWPSTTEQLSRKTARNGNRQRKRLRKLHCHCPNRAPTTHRLERRFHIVRLPVRRIRFRSTWVSEMDCRCQERPT